MTGAKEFLAAVAVLSGLPATLAWTPFVRPAVAKPAWTSAMMSSQQPWNGEVVSNTADGTINGCSIEPVGSAEPILEWKITIDG